MKFFKEILEVNPQAYEQMKREANALEKQDKNKLKELEELNHV
jgi:hypothetical protein